MKTWSEVYENAKLHVTKCSCCKECNGIVCKGQIPAGVGGKGTGASFIHNVAALKKIYLQMDTIVSNEGVDTSSELFGHPVSLPVYGAPICGIENNYGANMSDQEYTQYLIEGSIDAGVISFTGDGKADHMFQEPIAILDKYKGKGVPTIKPWLSDMDWRIALANKTNVIAIASDIDAAGLINLHQDSIPISFKDVEVLKTIKQACTAPFIAKGIMTRAGALKALEAGADGIVVSNHGGRVLDYCRATIEVLPEIVDAVQGRMKIFVDGGFRSGEDVFKALALGADGVLIGRPLPLAAIGGKSMGVSIYFKKIQEELQACMAMCGCKKISDIGKEHVHMAW